MRPLSRNIVGVCIASLVVAGAVAVWQREKIGGVLRGDLANRVQGPEVHDPSTRGGEIGTLVALAPVCGVVLTLHVIRERRGVAASTERVGTGDEPRVRRVDDDLAAAFESARRVTQELNLESDREARSRHRPRVLSRLLDVGALEMILEAHPDAAELRILDTGPGIPTELQLRIFDAHFTTKSTGNGIGLYLARAIVEAHGGEIRVGNRPVRGSEFRLRLPALAQGG